MIKKERQIPLKLQKLEALLRRLPELHPKRSIIEQEYAKSMAGYKGEKSLDYHLSFLPEKDYLIFHDLRLQVESNYFQIDTLIVTQTFIVIIEVKNMIGTLFFDHRFNQLIRSIDGVEEGFPDPILQVERQRLQLKKWFNLMKIPKTPTEVLVTISNPSTIIKTSSNNPSHYKNIIHSAKLVAKIDEFEKLNKTAILTNKDMHRLSKILTKHNTPKEWDVLTQFNINSEDILNGIHCPKCFHIPMVKHKSKWLCSSCNYLSKDVYLPSLKDYALLISPIISNQQFREFLNVQSRTVVLYIAHSLKLPHTGETKGRKYKLQSML